MLPVAASYRQLVSDFRWDIPARYNMGVDVCDKWAAIDPEKLAIIDLTGAKRRDVSFGELKTASDNLAVYLTELGIKRGDRVGVYRSQSLWTAAAHIAIWKMGAISIPLFKLFAEEALHTRLQDSGAKAVLTDIEGRQIIQAFSAKLPNLQHCLICEDLNDLPEKSPYNSFQPIPTNANDQAIIIYTSGTTGAPKGALHAHRILLGHLPGVEMSHDLFPQENDVIWTPADWAWIGGLFDVLMPALHHGVPVVASRMTKFNADECKNIITTAKVTNIFFPPTALKMLKASNFKIEGLRSVASGGEPLGEEMLDWGRQALGLTINEFYGQTECNMVVSSCGSLFAAEPGIMGKPVPGHKVRVVDENGAETKLEGDIAIAVGTPVMMLEYWNNPKATLEKYRIAPDGSRWLITGDRGIMQGDAIRFIGRDDDVITSAGYRIGPAEIEDCLLKHPAIASVGVIGKPDTERTQIVKAYVLLREGVEPSEILRGELQDHVKSRLAKHEYPREIEFVSQLPMTVTGKIIRKELRRIAVEEINKQKVEA